MLGNFPPFLKICGHPHNVNKWIVCESLSGEEFRKNIKFQKFSTMSGKSITTTSTTTASSGFLKPTVPLPQRSLSTSNSRPQSKERHRKLSISGIITSTNDSNAAYNSNLTSNAANANIITTTCTSSSKTATTTNNTNNATTCPPTIIKTPAPPSKNAPSSPLLRSASPHTRSVSISVTSTASTTRNANNASSSSVNQTRNTSTTSSTHLSPWVGPTTYTSNGTHKKNSATADSRLVVLGYPAVGKSALVVRLLTGRFIWEYDPTLEAAYRHHTTVDDESAVMDILDTAGQTEGLVNEAHARWGDGFVLVFSLTDRRSFDLIKDIHEAVATAKQTPNFSCIIIANKTDLGHLAEVSEDQASEVAGELGASLFLTSACDGGPAIHAAFSELHRDVVRRRWTRRRRSSAKTVIEGFYKMFSR